MDRRQPARRLTTQPKRSARDIIISYSSDEETKGDDDAQQQQQQQRTLKAERASSTRAKNNNILMLSPDAPKNAAKPAAKPAAKSAKPGKAAVKRQATARTKSSQQGLSEYPVLNVGDWIDVLDDVGVWNTAQVLSIPSEDSVKVRYDGWGDEYNEVVVLDSDRIAPFHTYTWSVKCWVRYLNWPWWPAVTTIRVPGNKIGSANLQKLTKLHVNFLDQNNFTFWISKKDIIPFNHKFEQNCKESTGQDFECSLNHVLQSSATNEFPKFAKGTLLKQFEFSEAAEVPETRRAIGDAQWFENFARNRALHFQMHGGKVVEHVPEKMGRSDKAASSKSKKSSREEEEEGEDEEVHEEPSSDAKKPRRTKVTKKSKSSAASPSRQLVLNEAATGKSKASPAKAKSSVKGRTITTAARQKSKTQDDAGDEDDEQVAGGGPHFHAAAKKSQAAKDSKRKETPVKKVVVSIAKPTTTKLQVKALKETTPQVRKPAKSEALTPQKKISTAKQTKTVTAPTKVSTKHQKQSEEPTVIPNSRKRARAGEKEEVAATTKTAKPRVGKRAEVLGEAVAQVKSEPIELFTAETEAACYSSSASKARKKLRTTASTVHEADFDRYDDGASDESSAPAPNVRKKLKTKATESGTVKVKTEPKQPRAVKAANTILQLSKPVKGAKNADKAEIFHDESSPSSRQTSMLATSDDNGFVYSTPPLELDHLNEYDAPPLEKGKQTARLKTSEKKTARTKMKATAKANGKPKSGKKAQQPVKNEEDDDKVDLNIVKKWGVFSPQRFGGRVSMMRVGAHVTQSMMLDDDGDDRPFVCVSAANKFGDHVQYPTSHSVAQWPPAPRGTVFNSSDGFSTAKWFKTVLKSQS